MVKHDCGVDIKHDRDVNQYCFIITIPTSIFKELILKTNIEFLKLT
jgi:hypothetical protein